ncbi:MAG: hypothetical protein QOE90_463 [Thermoplasmata archaeon]|jgi:hypothetical protein|nr:hypothetical protein [Thermoplasmata archaeon]
MKVFLIAALLLTTTVVLVTPGASACAAEDPSVDFVVCVFVPYCTGGTIKDEGGRLVTCVEYVLP